MGTVRDKSLSAEAAKLRSRAEEALETKKMGAPSSRTEADPQRLIHELEVHQIELEMQNSELRRAWDEKEKMESQLGRYGALYDFAPVGYFNLDRSGIIRTVNFTGAKSLGVDRSLLVNKGLEIFVSIETRPVFHEFLEKVFASETKATCEVVFLKDRQSPIFVQIEAVLSESGEECRAVIIDITERRQAEEALKQLNEELENRVADRTEILAATIRNLREEIGERLRAVETLRENERMLIHQSRQAAMGEMIGYIAHQWRQPLNALGLTVQKMLLFCDHGEFDKEFLEKSVGDSMELIRHMSRTIDDFMNYFRPDKEKVKFTVHEVIANTLSLIRCSFNIQKIGIEVVVKDEPVIHGCRNEFAQVILNILNNARDALTERGTGNPMVMITVSSEDERAVITIADNAGGIPEKILGRIFDPYFSTKGPQAGTGVGLFMSKAIIEKNMGGSLVVRNIADGAEFRIEV